MRLQPLLFSLSLILLFGFTDYMAQTIDINTLRAKETYKSGETILKQKDVKQRMASDQASLDKFVSGQGWNIGGIATCGAGGIVLVSGVGLAIDNSVKNEVLDASEKIDDSLSWTLIGVGVGDSAETIFDRDWCGFGVLNYEFQSSIPRIQIQG
jgi:hypothetical protein